MLIYVPLSYAVSRYVVDNAASSIALPLILCISHVSSFAISSPRSQHLQPPASQNAAPRDQRSKTPNPKPCKEITQSQHVSNTSATPNNAAFQNSQSSSTDLIAQSNFSRRVFEKSFSIGTPNFLQKTTVRRGSM